MEGWLKRSKDGHNPVSYLGLHEGSVIAKAVSVWLSDDEEDRQRTFEVSRQRRAAASEQRASARSSPWLCRRYDVSS